MNQQFTWPLLAAAAAFWVGTAGAEQHAHPHLAPDVDAFHAILAPLWHAPVGEARSRNACAKAGTMAQAAGAIGSVDASGLTAALAGLQSACQGRPTGGDAAFSDVHAAFHQLLDARPPVSAR